MPETLQAPAELRHVVEAEQYRDRGAKPPAGIRDALRALDPGLELLRVRVDAAQEILPPGAVAGRWHVCNRSAKPLPTFAPIETPHGNYREPDSGVIREYAARDLSKASIKRAFFDRPERERRKAQRAKELEAEQRRDVLKEDLKAGWRVAGRIRRDDGTPVKRKVPTR